MTYDTINDAQTIGGNGEGTLLANRYRVVRQLGQGGMGSVWLAEDTQLDNKPFAIKMLPTILVANKRAYRQLKDEALVAMRLVHPNIVQIRAFEENNGNPFLVMDYIDGQTLDDCLAEKGKLSEDEVLRVLRPIAVALDYAHSKGVVHRDVKPGNVMIAKDGTPYILDFGIAREIQETMTRVTGKLSSGTLLYMSPEQLNGEQPKKKQDIYSFAAMAYECLKGEPPFARGQIEYQILNTPPPSLGGCGVLDASVMAGLSKKPEDRPPSCRAVLMGDDFNSAEHVERVESAGRGVPDVPKSIPSSDSAEVEALKARVEAKVTQKHIAELPNEGFFQERKQELDDELIRAEVFYEAQSWDNAARCFLSYIKRGDSLLSIRQKREIAESKRMATFAAKESLAKRGCSNAAAWQAAESILAQGEDQFQQMAFEEAARLFDSACEIFGQCTVKHAMGDVMTLTLPGGAQMEILYIAPGSFMMGSENGRADERPVHKVTLTKGFWMGKYPVTQAQWKSVMGSNPSCFKGDDRPVETISWDDCQKFIGKVNKQLGNGVVRLPTEAEWEYVCRAGTTGGYGGSGRLDDMGWYDNTFFGLGLETHPVGQKKSNAWGFCDVHGNVWEWCADWYGEYPTGNVVDPMGPSSGSYRVKRGGSWSSSASCCTSSFRNLSGPSSEDNSIGFRLVRTQSD